MKGRASVTRTPHWLKPSRVERVFAALEEYMQLVIRREYRGNNPALAAVHVPLRHALLLATFVAVTALVFGVLVPIESAAIAHGYVAVLSNKKTVQHFEGGIIKSILVKEGEGVKVGQPLMELSDIAPRASQSIVQGELSAAYAAAARISALRADEKALRFPVPLLKEAEAQPDFARTLQTQAELFTSQREAHKGKITTLNQRIAQLNEEIRGLQAQVRSTGGQLAYIEDEIGSVEKLFARGYATKPRLLALKRQREELQGNRGQLQASIAKAQQTILETRMQVINLENEFATQLAEEQRDVQGKIKDFEEKLRAANDVMQRTVIAAPSEGIVTGLKYHTVGGVVQAGQPIMDIVPQSDALLLECRVQPSDIDVVKPGLDAKVVFSAYKTRNLPRLRGTITRVSADVFTDQQRGQNYYLARVEVDGAQLAAMKGQVNLYPGMPVEIFIRTGSRSFMGYFFSPITDSMRRAFREE